MKLPLDPRLPITSDAKMQVLTRRLYELFREYSNAFNDSYMWDTQGTAAPTTGTWSQSNKCMNTAPVESGTAGSKTVTLGWVCTVSGTPGTWLPIKTLTGN